MSDRGGKQRGIRRDSSFNLCLTWPSSIAKSDLLHDGCSGTPRLAQTTSGRNLGVFVSTERRGPQNRWGGEFSSSLSLIVSPSFFPSQPSHISIPPPDSVTRPHCFGPQGFSTSGDFSLEMKIPEIMFSSTISWCLTVLWLERNQRKAKKPQKTEVNERCDKREDWSY